MPYLVREISLTRTPRLCEERTELLACNSPDRGMAKYVE